MIIDDDESDYRNEIELLVKWSKDSNLILNVNKPYVILDIRKCRNSKDSIIINDSSLKQGNIYTFLGLNVINTLSWTQDADKIMKFGIKRLFYLRILKSYNVDINVVINFYFIVIKSVLTTNILVWFGCTNKREIKKIESIIRSDGIIDTSIRTT